MNATQLLPSIRDLYRRLPETYHLQPWELQWTLFALNYTNELEDEDAIADAVAVAWPQFFQPISPRRAA
jgi:hypothetical protein